MNPGVQIACNQQPTPWGPVVLLFALTLPGCSGSNARVEAPKINAKAVAQHFLDIYDTDEDGVVSSDELADCPALVENLRAYDENSDAAISLSELRNRLGQIYGDRVAFYPLHAHVTLNGRPLRGARVKFAPEEPLGNTISVAEGETNQDGYAVLSVSESEMPSDLRGVVKGLQTGLYRIHIDHESQSLPEKVVSGDHFGAEITSEDGNGGVELAIRSR